MVFSPLEQFQIISLLAIQFPNYDLSFTNSSLVMLVTVGFFIFLSVLLIKKGGKFVPSSYQSLIELVYEFVMNLVDEQIGPEGKKFFTFIFTVFTFLLLNNLFGMVPYSFTATSHLIVTFSMSLSLFLGITIIGFQTHGIHFFSFLLPKGAPLALAPLLVVLELISYCFRGISLGVRLFANMMAGHTLVKILAGFAWTMAAAGGFLKIASLIPFLVVLSLTGLELAVAFLQAYVFTILTCIYMHDAIYLH